MSEKSVRLIVCDLAGTTVDYGGRAPAAAFRELFRRHGVECTEDEIRAPMGRHKRDHIREMFKMESVAARWRAVHGRDWTEEDVERLFQEFIPLQTTCLLAHNMPIPGAVAAVARWREAKKKVAATTGYNVQMTQMIVADAAKRDLHFDFSCCAEEVSAGRPAPWMIYRCMEAAGVYPPTAVVKIGDTVADIEEALNAGVWAVGVTRTGNMLGLSLEEEAKLNASDLAVRLQEAKAAMAKAGAHYVVESIAECAAIVTEIESRLAAGITHFLPFVHQ
ncbi:MAG: phosphonoacetaldehyde hydrolase [Planctomycetota bacterium]|nr:phosphonoacetaldehyde hydrolase [Planctomycetota bacterium]